MWNSIYQKDSEFIPMLTKPVAMFENPFLKSPHKLVLCDMWKTNVEPAGKWRERERESDRQTDRQTEIEREKHRK